MMNRVLEQVNKKRAERRRQIALLLCLSVLVPLGICSGTLRTGIALSNSQLTLACPFMGEGSEPVAHFHNTSCYDSEGMLVCSLPEREAHTHTDDCYREGKELVCGREENPGHTHTDTCYAEETVQVCNLDETAGHRHTEDCYSEESEEPVCRLEEGEGAHQHTDECFRTERTLICGKEIGESAHVHTDECWKTGKVLSCGQEALVLHVHDDSCFMISTADGKNDGQNGQKEDEKEASEEKTEAIGEKTDKSEENVKNEQRKADSDKIDDEEEKLPEKPDSDPSADLETPEIWEKAFEKLTLTGEWAEDLIAVAETQFGYAESELNFDAVLNKERDGYVLKGWTRYGAWYGIPYGDWCAMFVSFCLHYAGISDKEYPYDCGTTTWVRNLEDRGLFSEASEYSPMPGDLVFFDWEQDGLTDHVGLVYGVDAKDNYLLTIEGNHTRTVQTFEYALNDPQIIGYGILKYVEMPEEEEPEEAETSELTENEEPEFPQNNTEAPAAAHGKASVGMEKAEKTDTTDTKESSENPALKQYENKNEEAQKRPDESSEATEVPKRVQRFDKTVAGIRVQVEADEGAFPENTYMSLAPIDGNCLKDAVAGEIDGEILEIQAVDIVFVNEFGEELEPAIPIRVSITVQETQYSDRETEVVHIDDNGTPSIVPQAADEETESNCKILFDADSFTPYAIVRKTDSQTAGTEVSAVTVPEAEKLEEAREANDLEEKKNSLIIEGAFAKENRIASVTDSEVQDGRGTDIGITDYDNQSSEAVDRSDMDNKDDLRRTAEKNTAAESTEDNQPDLVEPVQVEETNRHMPEYASPIRKRNVDAGYWTILGFFAALAMSGSLWLLERSREREAQ